MLLLGDTAPFGSPQTKFVIWTADMNFFPPRDDGSLKRQ